MKTFLATLVSCLFLTGCPAIPKLPEEQVMKAGLVASAIKTAEAPLLEITCPVSGCQFSSLKVGNPAGSAQLAETVRIAMTPQVSASERIWLSVIDKGFGVLGVGLIANGVRGVMGEMFKSNTAISTGGFNAIAGTAQSGFNSNALIAGNIPQPGAVTTTNTSTVNTTTNTNLTASGAGSAVASGGNASGNNPISTTTTTTNPTRTCTTGPTGVQTCTGG